MKQIIMGAAACAVIAVAAPAATQYSQNGYTANTNSNFAGRIDQLQARLQAGTQAGLITRGEAVPIRQNIRALRNLERQYAVSGLTGQERADLQQRIRAVRQQLRIADGGAGGRYAQWDREDGYNNGYVSANAYASVDVNRDGWDDRDLNRDSRLDQYELAQAGSGYAAPQGYAQPSRNNVVGNLIGTLLGTSGLQVGQRVTGNLYGVPPQYQNYYRDGNGVYYRADGQRIYQIDAQTHTVVNVYSM